MLPPVRSKVPPSRVTVFVSVPRPLVYWMFPPTVREPVPVILMVAVATLLASSVVAPMVRFAEPARVSDPALMLSAERAELTVTAAFDAEF